MNQQDIPKLYYSISEVSRTAEVDQHVLRYWETEFKELNPRKNRNGKRLYKEADLAIVKRIKELLYTDRYTIEGARRRLKLDSENGVEDEQHEDNSCISADVISSLRQGLLEVKELLKDR